MDALKLADTLERFAQAISDVTEELRDHADAPNAAPVGREVDADAPADTDTVEVSYGDLWRLVNRSRMMIRLAREGKVPSQEKRAPLCRAIKTLKQQGAIRKPRNVRD